MKEAPLCVFVPNILIPDQLCAQLPAGQREAMLDTLPSGLRKALARAGQTDYVSAGHLDRVEAWLLNHLDSSASEKFEHYPPWAMLGPQAEDYCQWWGSVGNLEITRDGVLFTPPEVMQVTERDLQKFWTIVSPILTKFGWSFARSSAGNSEWHQLLVSETAVPMEQPSPWSVQGVHLTDCLPMRDECAHWRKLWHALQVELSNAPFNQEREQRGLKPLNALWFWGGGKAWAVDVRLPRVFSVTQDGVYQLAQLTTDSDEVSSRFVFWLSLLEPLQKEDDLARRASVYCVEFEGWGGSTDGLRVLENEVLLPMRLAGLALDWVLVGLSGWRQLHGGLMDRLKFWKKQPDWQCLSEPSDELMPSEEELQAAWAAGQQDQAQIESQWRS